MSEIEISLTDGVQTLRINRPDKKNALTAAMYGRLTEALDQGGTDRLVKAHLFAGLPGVFTAGNDIGDFARGAVGGEAAFGFVRQLATVDKPMLAAVDGLAVGIGTTLLFHCDLVYASSQSRFMTPFLDLGLVPEAGSSLLAPRLMGHARAFELLVLGNGFDAERAKEAGLVNAVVEPGEVEGAARAAGVRLAGKPPQALALSRRLLRGEPAEIEARIEAEGLIFKDRLQSDEARAAFAAFLGKARGDGTTGGAR